MTGNLNLVLVISFGLTDDLGFDETSNHPIEFHVPQPFGPLQFKRIILIFSNSLASFNLQVHIFVRVLESNIHVHERSNIIRDTVITAIRALIIVGDETSSNKWSKKKTNNYTPGLSIMRIHLVPYSTSARSGKNPQIFTKCEFIQLVRTINNK